jgi:hypothetical protein
MPYLWMDCVEEPRVCRRTAMSTRSQVHSLHGVFVVEVVFSGIVVAAVTALGFTGVMKGVK